MRPRAEPVAARRVLGWIMSRVNSGSSDGAIHNAIASWPQGQDLNLRFSLSSAWHARQEAAAELRLSMTTTVRRRTAFSKRCGRSLPKWKLSPGSIVHEGPLAKASSSRPSTT